MSEGLALRVIRMRTLEAFGYSITPHQFRHAAATFLAEKHLELIAIASDVLGHACATTTEAYYNRASAQSGAMLLQATLIEAACLSRQKT